VPRYSAGGMRSMASRRSSNAVLITPRRCSTRMIAYTRASQSAWKNCPSSSTGIGPNPVCPPMSCTLLTRPTLSRRQPGVRAVTAVTGVRLRLLTQFDAEHDRMAAALESADDAMRELLHCDSLYDALRNQAAV